MSASVSRRATLGLCRKARGTILQVLLSMPGTYYIQFERYGSPKLMRARDLERVDAVP